jgi:hypothetical protein
MTLQLDSATPKINFTLSSSNDAKECIDFFLTRNDESLSTFLAFGKFLTKPNNYV